MKNLIVIFIALWAQATLANNVANLNKSGVILDGYDAFSYFQGDKPKKGDPKFQVKQDDAIYWFASEEDKQAFLKDPKKFAPQFAGWCAYAVADSKEKVDVDPTSFLIQDGRLLLFYNGLWGNTREKWLHTKDKDAKIFLKDADANWPLVQTKAP